MNDRPPLYQTRIVEVGGVERLAYDIAKKGEDPVAVVGPGAVECPKCRQKPGDKCLDPTRPGATTASHFERTIAMNKELTRLRELRDRDLSPFANPDCKVCGGDGGTSADPCPKCIVEVWS